MNQGFLIAVIAIPEAVLGDVTWCPGGTRYALDRVRFAAHCAVVP